jgi:hypothetical protein
LPVGSRCVRGLPASATELTHSLLRVDDMLCSRPQACGGRVITNASRESHMRELVIAPAIVLMRVLVKSARMPQRSKAISQILCGRQLSGAARPR